MKYRNNRFILLIQQHKDAKMKLSLCLYAITFFVFLPSFQSCHKEEVPVSRTIIVYMVADNNLWREAYIDLDEIQYEFKGKGTNLIVFVDPDDDVPQLLEITPGGSKTLKAYQEFNSADATRMGQILSDITGMYPAEEYGLILLCLTPA